MSGPSRCGRPRRPRPSTQAGLTLIELMIAMVILGIVIAAAFNVAYTIMNGYRDHRRAVAVERTARGAMAVLTEAIRNASPGVPNGNVTDVITCSAFKAIQVTNSSTEPDRLRLASAKGGVLTSTRATFDQSMASVTVLEGAAFKVGDHVMVTSLDTVTPAGYVYEITDVTDNGGDWTLDLNQSADSCGALFSFPPLAYVIRMQVTEYYVDTDYDVPQLMRDVDGAGDIPPEPVAEAIEDLQIALGIDQGGSAGAVAGDGKIDPDTAIAGDDDEWVHNHPDDSAPGDPTTVPYRAVRVTVTARSTDETSNIPVSLRPPAEDREGSSTADVYRRRSLSTTVEVRNLQGSPL